MDRFFDKEVKYIVPDISIMKYNFHKQLDWWIIIIYNFVIWILKHYNLIPLHGAHK